MRKAGGNSFKESNVEKGMVLPFTPLTMTFNNVHYFVDCPPVSLEPLALSSCHNGGRPCDNNAEPPQRCDCTHTSATTNLPFKPLGGPNQAWQVYCLQLHFDCSCSCLSDLCITHLH